MITSWDIYWITRLDGIGEMLAGIAAIGFMVMVCTAIFYAFWIDDKCREERGPHWKRYRMALATLFCVSFMGVSLRIMTPTTKEFAAIYLLPKIANNEQVQKVPENLLKLLNTKMEAWIQDTLKENK
jgi:hypothetical protein